MSTKRQGVLGVLTSAATQKAIRAALPNRQAAVLPVVLGHKRPIVSRSKGADRWDDIRQQGFHIADIIIGILCFLSILAHDISFSEPMTWGRFYELVGPASACLYMTFIGMITIAQDAKSLFARMQAKLAASKFNGGD